MRVSCTPQRPRSFLVLPLSGPARSAREHMTHGRRIYGMRSPADQTKNSNSFTALNQQSRPRTAVNLPRALLDANSTRFYVIVPPLTHPNADMPNNTGSLGWQQLNATLDSLGRFGYDDVVLIDNSHQQGPLLRQSFARPMVASSGRQYSFSALADALRHAMHGGLADAAGARWGDGGVGAEISRKHMVLLGHNVRLCRPLRRPRCAVSPLIHTLMGHITAWLCVHTHCCLVMCAHTLLLGYVHT